MTSVEELAKKVDEAAESDDWGAALEAAQNLDSEVARELLHAVVNGARAAGMTDTDIAKKLGVTQPAVYDRFPPPEPKWRRKPKSDA